MEGVEGFFFLCPDVTNESQRQEKHPEATGRRRRRHLLAQRRATRTPTADKNITTDAAQSADSHKRSSIHPQSSQEGAREEQLCPLIRPQSTYCFRTKERRFAFNKTSVNDIISVVGPFWLFNIDFLRTTAHGLKRPLQPGRFGGTMAQTMTRLIRQLIPTTQIRFPKVQPGAAAPGSSRGEILPRDTITNRELDLHTNNVFVGVGLKEVCVKDS